MSCDCGECVCSLDWSTSTPEEFADAIEALCVEKAGDCQRGGECRCKNGEVAEQGEW